MLVYARLVGFVMFHCIHGSAGVSYTCILRGGV